MAFAWHPLGALALVEGVVLLAVGLAIYLAGPRRQPNRWLALTLGTQAFADVAFPMTTLFADDPRTTEALINLNWVASLVAVFAYLAFLGAALDTPLVRPFATRGRRQASFALGIFLAVGLVPPRGTLPPPITTAVVLLAVVSFLYGLVAALHAWRRAPRGSPRRARSAAYARAFGIRDAAFLAIIVPIPFVPFDAQLRLTGALLVAQLLYVALLAHAILRDHLFDIDLKLKWTIRRGTLAAIFVVAILAVAEIAQLVVSNAFGIVAGIVAAVALFFAKRPLERVAERIANATMPHVKDTAEYRLVRKREVYRAALESAMEDGTITDRERNVLATLADQLGLGVKETLEIEREIVRSAPS